MTDNLAEMLRKLANALDVLASLERLYKIDDDKLAFARMELADKRSEVEALRREVAAQFVADVKQEARTPAPVPAQWQELTDLIQPLAAPTQPAQVFAPVIFPELRPVDRPADWRERCRQLFRDDPSRDWTATELVEKFGGTVARMGIDLSSMYVRGQIQRNGRGIYSAIREVSGDAADPEPDLETIKPLILSRTGNIPARKLSRGEMYDGKELMEEHDLFRRPRRRGDCIAGPRPCPWVSCAHHLFLDVNGQTGSIKVNFASLEEMPDTCTLDVADRGGLILEDVGLRMNLTRERVRQVEENALERIRDNDIALMAMQFDGFERAEADIFAGATA